MSFPSVDNSTWQQIGAGESGGTGPLSFVFGPTNPNCVLYAILQSSNDIDYPTISDSQGLVWNERGVEFVNTNGAGITNLRVYWAISHSVYNGTITVLPAGDSNSFLSTFVGAISGINTSSFFDPLCPSFSTNTIPDGGNGTVSTANSNNLILALYGSGGDGTPFGNGPVHDPAWTVLFDPTTTPEVDFACVQTKTFATPQTDLVVPASTGDTIGFVADAFTFGVSAAPTPPECLSRISFRPR